MNTSQNVVSVPSPEPCFGLAVAELGVDVMDAGCQDGKEFKITTTPTIENVYIVTQHYNTQMSKRIVKYDDSKAEGEFYALDLDTWVEIDNHIIDEKRIGVGTDYSFKDVRVYIQIEIEGRTKNCEDKYILFYRKDWIELRRSRGPEKYQPGIVDEYGVIWTGKSYTNCKFRVFVKRE